MSGCLKTAVYGFAALILVSCTVGMFVGGASLTVQRFGMLPTIAPTATVTRIATPRPLVTQIPNAQFPLTIESDSGWGMEIRSMQLLDKIETSTKRFRPNKGVYLILLGELTNGTDEHACIHSRDFGLRFGGVTAQPEDALFDKVKPKLSGRNYPGSIQGQCLDYDEVQKTFLLFDAPRDQFLWLSIEDNSFPLGVINELTAQLNTSTPTQTQTPIAALVEVSATTENMVNDTLPAELPVSLPTATVAESPTNQLTVSSTPTHEPTATMTPSPTATASRIVGVVVDQSNLRAGPGTDQAIAGSAAPGTEVIIVGSDASGEWYQLDNQMWIAGFLVEQVSGEVPTLQPTATPKNTSTPRPTATPLPLVPTCYEIEQLYDAMTDAQWNYYSHDGIRGAWVDSWQGVVGEVEGWSILLWGYPMHIEITPDCDLYYVIDDESKALQFVRGETVTVTGRVDFISEFWGSFTIYMDEEKTSISR